MPASSRPIGQMADYRKSEARRWSTMAPYDLLLTAPAMLRAKRFSDGFGEYVVATLCTAAIVFLFLVDVATPRDVTVSVLVLFPVFAAAWLTSRRLALPVAALAVALQLVLGFTQEVNVTTALATAAAVITMSWVGHEAAVNSNELRESRERQLTLLLEAARSLSSSAELPDVLANIVKATAAFISHGELGIRARATIWRIDGDCVVAVHEHDDLGYSMAGQPVPMSEQLRRIVSTRRAGTVLAEELAGEMRELYESAEVAACACAPVYVNGEPYAVLTAASRDEEAFSRAELRLLAGIADLASLALANAQKLERERARTRVFQVLHSVGGDVGHAHSAQDLAQKFIRGALELAEADVAILALRENRGNLLRVVADEPRTHAFILKADSGLAREVIESKMPVVLNGELDRLDGDLREIATGASSVAGIPIASPTRSLGVLFVVSRSSRMSDEAVQSLALLATQLAAGLEDVKLRSDLVESDRRFRSLYAALGCGVVVYDPRGTVLDVNWAAGNILGMTAEELRARPPFGAGWRLELEDGSELPTALHPPAAVINFQRPIRNLVACVNLPNGNRRRLRVDCTGIEEQGRLQWVVTSFFELTTAEEPEPGRSSRSRPKRQKARAES